MIAFVMIKVLQIHHAYIFLLLSLICNSAYSQQLHSMRFWNIDDGLPSRNILCMAEDEDGLIWVGTERGLIRFDGRRFVSFAQIISQHPLDSGSIQSMCYKAPYLWLGSSKGLFVLDTRSYTIKQVNLPPAFDKSMMVYKLRTGNIALAGSEGHIWIARSPFQVQSIPGPGKPLYSGAVFNITDDENDNIWIASFDRHLVRINQQQLRVDYHHRFDEYVQKVFSVRGVGYLVKCVSGIYRFDIANNKLLKHDEALLSSHRSIFLMEENDSSLWISIDDKELMLYLPNEIRSFSYVFNHVPKKNFRVKSILRTHDCLWIGTNYGILKISVSDCRAPHYFTEGVVEEKNTSVRNMCEDEKRNLFFASYSGLYKIPYPYNPESIEPVLPEVFKKALPYSLLYEDKTLWVGSEGGGLIRVNMNTKEVKRFPEGKDDFKQHYIICIYNDTMSRSLLCGSYQGLFQFNKRTNELRKINLVFKNNNYNDAICYQIIKVGETYWICTNKGLLQCNSALVPVNAYSFSGYALTSISYDKRNNRFWIGTRGNGLIVFSNGNVQRRYTVNDGLADNNIASITAHGRELLVATYNGLSKFDPDRGTFVNLHTQQGLSENEFNHGAAFTTSNGSVFIGGVNGYNLYNYLNCNGKGMHYYRTPFVSSLLVVNENSSRHKFNGRLLSELFIPTSNKVTEFEFGLADYDQPEKNNYAYKLEGMDAGWIYLGNRNYLRIANLKPGSYKLHVKAMGGEGVWREMARPVLIRVDQHFYFKWWFIALVVSLVILAIVLYYRMRINEVKKLYNLRLQISSDLHDEVGSILTAVGMQAELLQHTESVTSSDRLKHIADTSRRAVSNMRDVVWSIDSGNDQYKHLIDRMNDYLVMMFENLPVHYEFIHNINSKKNTANPVMRQNAYLIFKEALNNISRHSNATEIRVELKVDDRLFKLSINNNGTPVKAYKAGMGLKNMEMRARKMKARLHIDKDRNYNLILTKAF